MIVFSKHALLKLRQRDISRRLVVSVLNSPDYEFSTYGGRKIRYKKFGKLYLKVIYKESKDILVITQHWEAKPKLIKE